jgi:hypothetical protein
MNKESSMPTHANGGAVSDGPAVIGAPVVNRGYLKIHPGKDEEVSDEIRDILIQIQQLVKTPLWLIWQDGSESFP